ncbi:MAG: DNA polymerase domain-containing protein [Haloarculaceae archaeon]
MEQRTLGGYGGGDADRPDDEAAAVAGNGGSGAAVVDTDRFRYPDADGTTELAVMQVDYTVEGGGDDEFPVVHVFGRTRENEAVHVEVYEFRPYFYAPTATLQGPPEEEYDRLTGSEPGYESIRGENLTKIFGQTPRDVGQIRDEFDHYEADILFPNRLLIDKDVTSGISVPDRRTGDGRIRVPHTEVEPVDVQATPRVNFFDIEVDDRSGFPEDGEEPIVCLTSHDSYRDEYVVWLYEAPDGNEGPDRLDGYDPIRGVIDVDVRRFDEEEAMLEAFVDYLDETDVDLMSGWNFEDFDAPYLVDRLNELDGPHHDYDLNPDRLSRVNEVWDSGWGGPDVKGRVVFDLLYAYKRTQFTELESYRLDAVGETELGVGKERYSGDIGDLWEDDPERLLEYNLRDVELCVELNREQDIIPFWDEVRTFVGCKIEDATTPGDAVDMYVLHKLHGEFALPSKGNQESEDYEGGAVFDPITGVRENVTVLDLKSLYPMCMVTVNASPETKVDPDEYDGDTYVAPNGTHFRKEPDGVIREMVDELLTEREEKKALRNENDPDSDEYERFDRQQAAVKVIMNCFTPDTEVLTPDGVHDIRDLEVGDDVYSLDPDTMEMEVKPVVETYAYPDYRGELVDVETSKIDLSVTPNHRMLVRKNDKNGISEDGWSFVEAGELYDYCHYEMPHDWEFEHTDELPGTIDIGSLAREHTDTSLTLADGGTKTAARYGTPNIQQTVETDDFLTFLAWYITEGSVYRAKTANYRVKIAQEDETNRAEIESLVDRLVDYHYTTDRSVSFSSKIWATLLEVLCGDKSDTKRIPDIVFRASEEQKREFLSVLIEGDGDRQLNSWRYSTMSEELRDDVLKLCTHLGLTANYNYDSGVWRIYCTEDTANSFRMHRSGSLSEATDGVYCVSVKDNNTLLAGRNGKFQCVGNSLYGVLGWDRFRLYDREMGAAVTATGRDVIEYTEQVANEQGYEVAYGDSVTGDRPVVVRDDEQRIRIVPIEELFQQAKQSEAALQAAPDGGTEAQTRKEKRPLPDWEALSLSDDGTAEWQPIDRVIRHRTSKDVVKLQHKFGESTTTRDHSYVVERDGEYVERTPSEVDEPLRISGLPEVESVETIDVYEVLDGYTRKYEDGRSVGSEEAETKVKRVHANDEYVWFGHEHHGTLDSTVKVKRYIDIESDDGLSLVRLLAAYVAEGSATTVETSASNFGASISESRRDWLQQIRDDYHRLFTNATANIVESDSKDTRTVTYENQDGNARIAYDDRTLKVQMMNELAAVFFKEFVGQTSRRKQIPSFVYHLPDPEQSLFLDVLVEGDGSREFPHYSDEYAERNFSYETTSRRLAAGVSTLLTQRDRNYSLKYRDEKDSYTIRTCEFYRSGRAPVLSDVEYDGYVYDLSVAENDNFVDGVGGVVLHNTDSVMLEIGDVSPDDVEGDVEVTDEMREKHPEMDDEELETIAATIQKGFELEEAINGSYDEFALERLNAQFHRFEIEFEKLYRRFFQAGKKKRYAGHIVWKEGKDVDDVDITGFEYQRSDIAPVTKEVQKEVIDRIVHGDDLESLKDYVHDVIEDFRSGAYSHDDIAIPGGIGKRLDNYDTDTAHVRGAKYANLLLGTNFQRGSKPKRLYLKKVHPDFFERVEREQGLDPSEDPLYGEFKRDPDVICFEYPDQIPDAFEVDYDKMLDKTLKGPIARILEALDVTWEEVKSGQEQTGLGNFM